MAITTIPTQTEGSLGGVKSDTGVPYTAATDVRASMVNEWVTRIIEVFNEVGKTDGSTASSLRAALNAAIVDINALEATVDALEPIVDGFVELVPSDTVAAGFDDFEVQSLPGWAVFVTGGARVRQIPSAAAGGIIPGSGIVFLNTDVGASDAAQLLRTGVGLVLDATEPLVTEWRIHPSDSGVFADDEFRWLLGVSSFFDPGGGAPAAGIVLDAEWSGTRNHRLKFLAAGVETYGVDVTMPAMGGGKSYWIRLTSTTATTTVEARVDNAAYAVIGTLTGASVPELAVYHPFVRAENAGGVDSRAFAIDLVKWSAKREADDAGAFVDLSDDRDCYQKEVRTRTISADDVLSNLLDEILEINTGGGNITVDLPDPAGRRLFILKKITTDTNTISVAQFASEEIEGAAATYALPGSAATTRPFWRIYSNGSNWYRI